MAEGFSRTVGSVSHTVKWLSRTGARANREFLDILRRGYGIKGSAGIFDALAQTLPT